MENQMVEDLSALSYIAPNLPRYEIDREKFWAWWHEASIPIARLTRDSRGNGQGWDGELWNGLTIWQKPDYQKTIVWKVNHQVNEELFGEIIERVHKDLPWYDIQGLTLWSNKVFIGAHHDGLPRDRFPSAPRINLIDECENDTFFLVNRKNLKRTYPNLRTGPNLFLFNNEDFVHGADAPIGGKKVLIRIDGPLKDPEGLQKYIREQVDAGAKCGI
jgi:hypothetical protein